MSARKIQHIIQEADDLIFFNRIELSLCDLVSTSLAWKDIESLFIALNIEVIEGRGSRVRFFKESVVASFHRAHPKKEAKPYQVRDARAFLKQLGVEP